MKYVFDAGPFLAARDYYPVVFKNFWRLFNELVSNESIISVREVFNEITKVNNIISEWASNNEHIFQKPVTEEFSIITGIMSKHPELIKSKNYSSGLPVADPFIISKAAISNLVIVTQELYIENAHKIPNICKELGILYITFEEFMINEEWEF
jgi:hypothetical protein